MKTIGIVLLAILGGLAVWYELFSSFGPWFASGIIAALLLLGGYHQLRRLQLNTAIYRLLLAILRFNARRYGMAASRELCRDLQGSFPQ